MYCSRGYVEPRDEYREREIRGTAEPIFQYVDWRYADNDTLRQLNSDTRTADSRTADCQTAIAQDCRILELGDTTSMLQDTRLLNGRTVEDSDCRRLWRRITRYKRED